MATTRSGPLLGTGDESLLERGEAGQQLVSRLDIEAAAERIGGSIRRTPTLSTQLGSDTEPLWIKAECLQIGGAFKFRGALNAIGLLTPDERSRGVVTHSSGNHAQALARAARLAGVAATVVMPRETPMVKQRATQSQGARVVLVDIADRAAVTERIRAETGAVFISPYDDPAIIAGQGTVGLEILADVPDVTTVYVPVSGGGLVSGIAAAIKSVAPEVRVIAVEPELAGDLAAGFASGQRVVWDTAKTGRTIADGLRTPSVGELNWRHIVALVDDVVTVSEGAILSAMRSVVLDAKVVCEPSGAVAVAGFLERVEASAGPAVAVVSGGNVDPDLLADVLAGRL
ncbi:MAG: threonine/serine dehydratase [Nocardioidaceae bacterium]|nr:threonine/serine dehydratase [Nocardioidaceae bacterium]